MGRLGLAKIVFNLRALPFGSILLYPFSNNLLSPTDRDAIMHYGISAVDCSWNRIATEDLSKHLKPRILPFLLAANPTNYAVPFKLSTLEAISASLLICGFEDFALELLSKVKWGEAFLALNREPLSLYRRAKDEAEIKAVSDDYRKLYEV